MQVLLKVRDPQVATMTAQRLYDAREETGFCSGADLHRFFQAVTGNPSPAGSVLINAELAQNFYAAAVAVRLEQGGSWEDFPATL